MVDVRKYRKIRAKKTENGTATTKEQNWEDSSSRRWNPSED